MSKVLTSRDGTLLLSKSREMNKSLFTRSMGRVSRNQKGQCHMPDQVARTDHTLKGQEEGMVTKILEQVP